MIIRLNGNAEASLPVENNELHLTVYDCVMGGVAILTDVYVTSHGAGVSNTGGYAGTVANLSVSTAEFTAMCNRFGAGGRVPTGLWYESTAPVVQNVQRFSCSNTIIAFVIDVLKVAAGVNVDASRQSSYTTTPQRLANKLQ